MSCVGTAVFLPHTSLFLRGDLRPRLSSPTVHSGADAGTCLWADRLLFVAHHSLLKFQLSFLYLNVRGHCGFSKHCARVRWRVRPHEAVLSLRRDHQSRVPAGRPCVAAVHQSTQFRRMHAVPWLQVDTSSHHWSEGGSRTGQLWSPIRVPPKPREAAAWPSSTA